MSPGAVWACAGATHASFVGTYRPTRAHVLVRGAEPVGAVQQIDESLGAQHLELARFHALAVRAAAQRAHAKLELLGVETATRRGGGGSRAHTTCAGACARAGAGAGVGAAPTDTAAVGASAATTIVVVTAWLPSSEQEQPVAPRWTRHVVDAGHEVGVPAARPWGTGVSGPQQHLTLCTRLPQLAAGTARGRWLHACSGNVGGVPRGELPHEFDAVASQGPT
jgi:hypothetical protein